MAMMVRAPGTLVATTQRDERETSRQSMSDFSSRSSGDDLLLQQLTSLQGRVRDLEKTLATGLFEHNREKEGLEDQLYEANTRADVFSNEAAKSAAKVKQLAADVECLKKQLEQADEKNGALSQLLATEKKKVALLGEQLHRESADRAKLQNSVDKLVKVCEKNLEDNAALRHEVTELKAQQADSDWFERFKHFYRTKIDPGAWIFGNPPGTN
jgi:chromosome segregation ATPase